MINSRIILQSVQNTLIWFVTENTNIFFEGHCKLTTELITSIIWAVILVQQDWELEVVTESLNHCLKKLECLLHSEVTSKTQVQTTSFAKCRALLMAGYFILYKILLPDLIGHVSFWFGFFEIFLEFFGILIIKISGSAERQTTHNSKTKTSFKKVKKRLTETKK